MAGPTSASPSATHCPCSNTSGTGTPACALQPREVTIRDKSLRVVERAHPKANPEDPGHVGAPTAGLVSGIAVQVNHPVERGAKLLTLEAMKMQSNIYAPVAGRVTKLLVTPGQHVEAKDLLVVIAP